MELKFQPKRFNWYAVEWGVIPTPGEIYILDRNDQYYLKIGDGIHTLGELPIVEQYNSDRSCQNCEHLHEINKNKIYAVCDETGKTFHMWQEDTRRENNCTHFIPLDDGYGDLDP